MRTLLIVLLCTSCAEGNERGQTTPSAVDAALDGSRDASSDSATWFDSGPDSSTSRDASIADSRVDASIDAAVDAPVDAPVDAAPADPRCHMRPDGTICALDENACTVDRCVAGRCTAGEQADCADTVACTMDVCTSVSATVWECSHPVSGGCRIGGDCIEGGASNPQNQCQFCNGAYPDVWQSRTGRCDDGNVCTVGDQCGDAGCVGTPRQDSTEPNNSLATRRDLGDAPDNSNFPQGTVAGELYPTGDEDWFTWETEDTWLGIVGPKAELTGVPSGTAYEVCVFVECMSETLETLICVNGSSSNAEGRRGCCSIASGANATVALEPECSSNDDDVRLFARVRQTSGTATCSGYSLRWGDD